ncbi:MAG: hypothetical protein EZS28_006617 [Streblomastix strix]|uniref:Uncharacterized protein n=1 Tax=Streblomastix strix TaxID=222440 RepID=A0A5J4WSS0_9EUKA|nr:MAG: hypothetical protein EZS28_006617 [Streblomastix strix]
MIFIKNSEEHTQEMMVEFMNLWLGSNSVHFIQFLQNGERLFWGAWYKNGNKTQRDCAEVALRLHATVATETCIERLIGQSRDVVGKRGVH